MKNRRKILSRLWYRPAVVDPKWRLRRQQRWFRTLGSLCLGGMTVYLLGVGYNNLVYSDFSRIQQVEMMGLHYLSRSDLGPLAGVKPSMTLFEVDLEAIKNRLLSHPWIREVHVRKIYPDTLTVRISERQPVAVVEEGSRKVLVDEAGKVLGEAQGNKIWPTLVGIDLVALRGDDPDQQSAFQKAMRFLKMVDQESEEPRRPMRIDLRHQKEMVVEWKGYRVRFGENGFQEMWRRFQSVKPDMLKRKKNVQEIDLRFPRQVIVR